MCYEYLFFKNANEVPGLNITNIKSAVTYILSSWCHPKQKGGKTEAQTLLKHKHTTRWPLQDGKPSGENEEMCRGEEREHGFSDCSVQSQQTHLWMCAIHLNKQTQIPCLCTGHMFATEDPLTWFCSEKQRSWDCTLSHTANHICGRLFVFVAVWIQTSHVKYCTADSLHYLRNKL